MKLRLRHVASNVALEFLDNKVIAEMLYNIRSIALPLQANPCTAEIHVQCPFMFTGSLSSLRKAELR